MENGKSAYVKTVTRENSQGEVFRLRRKSFARLFPLFSQAENASLEALLNSDIIRACNGDMKPR